MADAETDLTQTIASKALNSKAIRTDGVEVQQRDLRELVAADTHMSRKASANAGLLGIQFFKINRPGALPD